MLEAFMNLPVFDLDTAAHKPILLDVIRLVHLVAVAGGIGCVIVTDFTILRWLGMPIGTRHGDALEAAHSLIVPALALAWISGIALIGMTQGPDPATYPPKLLLKLGVVVLLTLTAGLISRRVAPTMLEYEGYGLAELPLARKLMLAMAASLSVSGWGSALMLGGLDTVAQAGWEVLVPLVGGLYVSLVAAAVTFAVVAHLRWKWGMWLAHRALRSQSYRYARV